MREPGDADSPWWESPGPLFRRSLMRRIGPIPLLDWLQYGRYGFEIPHYFAIRFVTRHDGDWKLDGMFGRCPLCHAAEGVDADVHA